MGSGNKFANETLLNALLAVKSNISNDIHVAEICKVAEIKDNKYFVRALNNKNNGYWSYCLDSLNVSVGDLVLILFTDSDFRINLSNEKNGKATYIVDSNVKHSIEYGVIIGKL